MHAHCTDLGCISCTHVQRKGVVSRCVEHVAGLVGGKRARVTRFGRVDLGREKCETMSLGLRMRSRCLEAVTLPAGRCLHRFLHLVALIPGTPEIRSYAATLLLMYEV